MQRGTNLFLTATTVMLLPLLIASMQGYGSATSCSAYVYSYTSSLIDEPPESFTCGVPTRTGLNETINNYLITQLGEVNYPFFLSTAANAWADASPGINRVFLNARGMSTPESYTYVNQNGDTGVLQNGYAAVAYAESDSSWSDRITITSTTLPNGSPVHLQTTFRLDASAEPAAIVPTDVGFLPWALWQEDERGAIAGLGTFWYGARNICGSLDNCPPPTASFTFDSTVLVGYTYGIGSELAGSAFASAWWASDPFSGQLIWVSDAYSILDASSTGLYGLDILTPGASYVSDSGHIYTIPASVPEPGSLLLLGSGLLGVAGTLRRKVSL